MDVEALQIMHQEYNRFHNLYVLSVAIIKYRRIESTYYDIPYRSGKLFANPKAIRYIGLGIPYLRTLIIPQLESISPYEPSLCDMVGLLCN